MPIYEYTCRACGHPFEHWHATMSDAAPGCPECGGEVKRRISAPAVRTGSTGGSEAAESAPAKPTLSETGVFGRKELNASLAAKGRN
jgi:putative FmdB family regulatory protein